MKKIVLLLTLFIIRFISFGQDGFKPISTEMKAYEPKNIGGLRQICSNSLDISTPTNWVPVGTIPTNASTFYNHSNWIAITNPQIKTYQFKRKFFIGRAGTYSFSVKGMGDNKMVLMVDNTTTLIDYDVTVASGFNTPAKGNANVVLQCGFHELSVTITNHGGPAGFYLDGSITSKEGCVSDEKVVCEIQKEVCRCPTGWLSNTTNEEGGITTDGKCKKMFCRLEGIKPLPANGTAIGSWGFTWADGIWAWGAKENGGAVTCKLEWITEAQFNAIKATEGRGEK